MSGEGPALIKCYNVCPAHSVTEPAAGDRHLLPDQHESRDFDRPLVLDSGAACVVFGISFIAVEAGHESPMLPLPLLRRRTLGPVALVGPLLNVSIYGLIFVLRIIEAVVGD